MTKDRGGKGGKHPRGAAAARRSVSRGSSRGSMTKRGGSSSRGGGDSERGGSSSRGGRGGSRGGRGGKFNKGDSDRDFGEKKRDEKFKNKEGGAAKKSFGDKPKRDFSADKDKKTLGKRVQSGGKFDVVK
jgi:hypothetical protein